MSVVNFSVAPEIKAAFNETFRSANKSAVLSGLMREAVARAEQQREGQKAIARILARHHVAPVLTTSALAKARQQGRV